MERDSILFILRGFPGLGRVIGSIQISKYIEQHFDCKIYYATYLQGSAYLDSINLDHLKLDSNYDITSLGIQPISLTAERIFDLIEKKNISTVFLDGEPLLAISLRHEFPYLTINSVLNPSDYENKDLRKSITLFFNHCYEYSDKIIIHGLERVPTRNPKIHSVNTILRDEIVENVSVSNGNRISVVFGGGARNSTQAFIDYSKLFLKLIVEVAKCNSKYIFDVFWPNYSDDWDIKVSANLNIYSDISNPSVIYDNEIIIARGGRNTISEILSLNKKAILFSISGEHRASEQFKNSQTAKRLSKGRIIHLESPCEKSIIDSIEYLRNIDSIDYNWKAGNSEMKEIVKNLPITFCISNGR